MSSSDSKNNVEKWLTTLLKKEKNEILTFDILGNSEKGDGYIGDIVFAEIQEKTEEGDERQYNLVLKCSKTSQALREKSPVKEAFQNEIYFYDVLFPTFLQFQKDRKIDEPFGKVPKCYGTLTTDQMEIIALENLKEKGYILWEKTRPYTRRQIDMVVQEYGKLHAVSIAMKEQEPEKFYQLANTLHNVMKRFFDTGDWLSLYEINIEEVANLLKDHLDDNILLKWLELKPMVRPFFKKIMECTDDLKVIIHGDCWNNNFMHYYTNDQLSNFVMIDWQLSTYSSPIWDLAYFLFTCVAEEDINDMDAILRRYHDSFTDHLRNLGNNAEILYPLNRFLEDWKKYCKHGILLATVVHRTNLSETEDIPDMAVAAEKEGDVSEAFNAPLKNPTAYRSRMKYIVKYAVENNLI